MAEGPQMTNEEAMRESLKDRARREGALVDPLPGKEGLTVSTCRVLGWNGRTVPTSRDLGWNGRTATGGEPKSLKFVPCRGSALRLRLEDLFLAGVPAGRRVPL